MTTAESARIPLHVPTIERIDVRVVRVRRTSHNRVTHSYGTTPDAHYALVSVEAAGVVGNGEAPTEIWWTGEDAASVRHAIERYLAPALVGRAVGVREAILLMDRALYGNVYAKAAIQMALWDLLGRRAGLPLYALLGGTAAERVPIKYDIGFGDVDHVRREVAGGRELGFRYFKLKLGSDLRESLERVEAAVAALGADCSIGVDVNGGWSLATALRALGPLAELGVAFLEQPVPRTATRALAEITRRSSIPVMAHESLTDLASASEAARASIAHLWSLTPSMHGGVAQTLDMLAIARADGIPCLLGSTFELGVATAHMLHLASAFREIRDCPVPSDVIGPLYVSRDVVSDAIEVVDGYVQTPDGPGLGVTLDEEFVAAAASDA